MQEYFVQLKFYVLVNVIGILYNSDLIQSEDTGITSTVCQFEKFNATCRGPGEVVVIDGALYGRMRVSRCITDTGYKQDGCSADVHSYLDHLCSGRRSCEIQVPNLVLHRAPSRCGDLMSYLEVSYHCLKVTVPETLQCRTSHPAKLPQGSGYIPSVLTSETQLGSSRCPWLIEVDPVQTITLSMVDFGLWSEKGSSGGSRQAAASVCAVYATIRDGSSSVEQHVCGGLEARENKIFTSTSNRIYIKIEENSNSHFLLKYEANGCTEYAPGEGMKVSRVGDMMVRVGCKGGEGFEIDLQCMGSSWTPLGNLPNCSGSATPDGWWGLGVSSLSHQGLLIVILVSVALLVVIIILTIGICCLCHFKSREQTRLANESFDPITGRYAMTSHPSELKELYPMLSKQDREPMDWERDYATTLQMRQMAHPMHAMNPDQHFFPPYHHAQSPQANCCYCPVHGPACADNTRGRTSSFRPHSEHIYEVPRFESETFDDCEMGGPTVYHELNNQNRQGFNRQSDAAFMPQRLHDNSHNLLHNSSHSASRNMIDNQADDCSAMVTNSNMSELTAGENDLSRSSSIPPYRVEAPSVPVGLPDELQNKT